VVVGWLFADIYGAAVGAAIGIVYAIAVRPQGTMTVTYIREQRHLAAESYTQLLYPPHGPIPNGWQVAGRAGRAISGSPTRQAGRQLAMLGGHGQDELMAALLGEGD
jgi:hypothetical protein